MRLANSPTGAQFHCSGWQDSRFVVTKMHPSTKRQIGKLASRHSRESGNPALVPAGHTSPSKAFWVPAFAGTTQGNGTVGQASVGRVLLDVPRPASPFKTSNLQVPAFAGTTLRNGTVGASLNGEGSARCPKACFPIENVQSPDSGFRRCTSPSRRQLHLI